MSPFSIFLRQVRESRALRQKDAAEMLGYEQSYISALENGLKGIPRLEFIQQLTNKFQLSDEEISEMNAALSVSRRTFSIPNSAKAEEFELAHRFEGLLGKLSPKQIQFLHLALDLSTTDGNGILNQKKMLRENRM